MAAQPGLGLARTCHARGSANLSREDSASEHEMKKIGAGKPREPARWKRALRSAGILPAGSGGIPAASFQQVLHNSLFAPNSFSAITTGPMKHLLQPLLDWY